MEGKKFDPAGWTQDELLNLADTIYERLGEINLEHEVVSHYQRCKSAADAAHEGLLAGETTAGAAAVLTAATGALRDLAKMRTDLYNADRVQLLEKVMVEVLKEFDTDGEILRALEIKLKQADK